MAKSDEKIAAATGISVNGKNPVSQAIHDAMVAAALAGHSAGHDDAKIRAAVQAARVKAKSEQA